SGGAAPAPGGSGASAWPWPAVTPGRPPPAAGPPRRGSEPAPKPPTVSSAAPGVPRHGAGADGPESARRAEVVTSRTAPGDDDEAVPVAETVAGCGGTAQA